MPLIVRRPIVCSAPSVRAWGAAGTGIVVAFGYALRGLSSERGISQERLAELSGLHRTYVGDVERGERNLSLVNVERLALALGVRPSELLARAEVATGR